MPYAVPAAATVGRVASLVIPLAVVLGSCRQQAATGGVDRGGQVAIGVALNPQRPGMATIIRGVELAIDQLNRERDRRGIRFVLRRAPDSLTGAVQIATALRNDPAVIGVVGHPESGSTLDASAIYSDAEAGGRRALVAVSPTATSPALSGWSDWVFRVCPTDLAASAAAARFALDSLGARRAAILYRNDSYGKDWSRAFAAAYEAAGGTVVQRDPYLAGVTEWEGHARYTATLAPDVVLFPGSAEDAELAIRALRRAGLRVPVLGGDAIAPLEAKADEFGGVRYTSFFQAAAATSTEGRAFVSAYRAKYDEFPDQRAALSYDAAMIIGRAVLAGKSDRRSVRDHVAGLSRARPHRGATGPIGFDSRNDAVAKPVVIATVGRQ
jgi:branched-chain amino acid transport system substrate-binding protein